MSKNNIYRVTGTADHWITAVEKRVWGLEDKYRKQWREINPGDTIIFHASKSEFSNSVGLIGYGMVKGKGIKKELWWRKELQEKKNTWPLIIYFERLHLTGDVNKLNLKIGVEGKSESQIKKEVGFLLNSCVLFEAIFKKFKAEFPKMGSISKISSISNKELMEYLESCVRFTLDGPQVKEEPTSEKDLKAGIILNNEELVNLFQCSTQGGMRRSIRKNSLVIISDHTRGIYEDKWIDDVLYYTGMGLEGDQDINFSQNKTLSESNKNGVEIYLFEVYESGKYFYHGRVKLADKPYKSKQLDQDNKLRGVWIFPLRLIDINEPLAIPEQTYKQNIEQKERRARQLTDKELDERISLLSGKASKRKTESTQYQSNPEIKEKAKRLAKGKCQLCGQEAPFKDKKDDPYLEGHHIIWLSRSGPDTLDNVVALCPNCHRKMHILNLEKDIRELTKTK